MRGGKGAWQEGLQTGEDTPKDTPKASLDIFPLNQLHHQPLEADPPEESLPRVLLQGSPCTSHLEQLCTSFLVSNVPLRGDGTFDFTL